MALLRSQIDVLCHTERGNISIGDEVVVEGGISEEYDICVCHPGTEAKARDKTITTCSLTNIHSNSNACR